MISQFRALPKFEKQFKKFFPKEQGRIRDELKKIKADPLIGEQKKGALAQIRVHKFKIHQQLYLLAYEHVPQEETIYLYAIATHENFYETLQKYVR